MSWTVVAGAIAIALVTGLGREARGDDWSKLEETAIAQEKSLS
jgi:SHS family lactate transporter-like MFS transporter